MIVIGGGIAGACVAARFGMDGRKVVMIEKNLGIDDTFRGEGLLPGGIHTLEKLGLKGKIVAKVLLEKNIFSNRNIFYLIP